MLVRKGGGNIRELTLISSPSVTRYYYGQFFDPTGMIVGAKIGNDTLPLHASAYSYTPSGALTPDTDSITVSMVLNQRSYSLSIPVTVADFDPVFNRNTWEQIAIAAALGRAHTLWNVGDVKYDTFGSSTTVGYRIIGFNHDDLDETDSLYSDTTYNGNTKKAAITIQMIAPAGTGTMNTTATQVGGWDVSRMRVTQMQNDIPLLPEALRPCMRTVKKWTSGGGYGTAADQTVICSADQLFLLAEREYINATVASSLYENYHLSTYAFYAGGGTILVNPDNPVNHWTRSPHGPEACTGKSHFIYANTSINRMHYTNANTVYAYYPAFCM